MAVLKRAGTQFKQDNLTILAAALTYYGMLAIVPGLVVLFALVGLLGSGTTHQLVNQVNSVAPGSSAHFVRTLIRQAHSNKTEAGIGAILGILVALWSASSYVGAFRRATNVIYGIGEGRPIWKTLTIRIGVTLVSVVILMISAVVVVVSGPIAKQIGKGLSI